MRVPAGRSRLPEVAALQPYMSEATPVTGEGWTDAQLTTVGAVATRTRQSLEQTLRQGQQTAPGGNR